MGKKLNTRRTHTALLSELAVVTEQRNKAVDENVVLRNMQAAGVEIKKQERDKAILREFVRAVGRCGLPENSFVSAAHIHPMLGTFVAAFAIEQLKMVAAIIKKQLDADPTGRGQ